MAPFDGCYHRIARLQMCGFAGFIGGQWSVQAFDPSAILRRMSQQIEHRGPDSHGLFIDREATLGLAHQRLAIIDLSPAGAQPMVSPTQRFVIVYNGEIYNHLEIRHELERSSLTQPWRGHSDTETLLVAIETWGVGEALRRCVGMFAFGLWDRSNKELVLARDRLGEKPLYYGWSGSGAARAFLFGSELKALSAYPGFEAAVDRDALTLFMRHNYIPAPYSIYQGISKLEPGCILTLSNRSTMGIERYWSGSEAACSGRANLLEISSEDATEELDQLLRRAVGQQMLADVPLGAFLSGGVDSSAIVALMQVQSSRPIKSFSIGFEDEAYNEAKHAKAVAAHLGTDHTEMYVTPAQALAVIPSLPQIYDEPFADSSQIPTHLVSKLARSEVTVALSGDAGDELFGGYNRYSFTAKFWGRLSKVPPPVRRGLAAGLTTLSQQQWNALAQFAQPLLPKSARIRVPGDKIHKGAGVLTSGSAAELYHGLISCWRDPENLVLGGTEPPTRLTGAMPELAGLNDVERMMALDLITYLTDDILVKVDRAAMAVSLETRVPLLDHRVVEYAWRLPLSYKIRAGSTKWILRQVLYRYVPKQLIERPKMGFGVPMGNWLRGPLREWAEDLLDEQRLKNEGYFDHAQVRATWESHVRGHVDNQYKLWPVLMFQAWLAAQQLGHETLGIEGRAAAALSPRAA